MFLDEEIPGPVTAVETKIIDPNAIATADDVNNSTTNTTVVYDNSKAPNPIFTINPTPEAEPEPTTVKETNDEHEENDDDDDEDYDDDNDEVE